MQINQRKLELFAYQTSQTIASAMNCSLSYIGDKLGLYQSLVDYGPCSSQHLADVTGFHERWLREWLRHQACAKHLDYNAITDKFSISPEVALVFCDKDNPYYFASGFEAFQVLQNSVEHLPVAFRSGKGLSYDDHGPACTASIAGLNNYVPRFLLVSQILPEIEGLSDALETGIKVADVGCGAGIALMHMAREFPNSQFYGYEVSTHALNKFKENTKGSSLPNIYVRDAREEPLPADGSFDFVCTFDVVHDVPYPDQLISSIRSALRDDGVWLCSDIRSFPTFEENLESNPSAFLQYGFSLLICMSSALSEPNGAGLGTLGFNEEVARKMTAEAGFTQFRKLSYENATNSYYEIRP